MIPRGYFDRHVKQNTGSPETVEASVKSSKSVALMSLRESWRLCWREYSSPLYDLWRPLVDTRPVLAAYATSVFATTFHDGGAFELSAGGEQADAVLDAIARLRNRQVLADVMVGSSNAVNQPKLNEVVWTFGFNDVVWLVATVTKTWLKRGRDRGSRDRVCLVLLVLSLLKGVTDPSRIATGCDGSLHSTYCVKARASRPCLHRRGDAVEFVLTKARTCVHSRMALRELL